MNPSDFIVQSNSLLSDRVRLAIMAVLVGEEKPIDFNALVERLKVTKGNLSAHILRLESEGLLTVKKEFIGRKPRTTYRCTARGRREMNEYLANIEALLKRTHRDRNDD
jgi:DNA-binding transcriptional ArsR family regulator